MPPRYAYWTIIAGGLPTAFRAAEREELLPTFQRIREKHPDAQMKWFARGKLWESQEASRVRPDDGRGRKPFRDARAGESKDRDQRGDAPPSADRPRQDDAGPPREKRGRDWRPGGEHRDPRQKFIDQKKQKNAALRQDRWQKKNAPPRERPHGGPPRDDARREPRTDAPRPSSSRPDSSRPNAFRPGALRPDSRRPDAPRGDWRDRPPADRGAKPFGDRDRKPFSDRPAKPFADRDRKPYGKPSGPRAQGSEPGAGSGNRPEERAPRWNKPSSGDRPYSDRPRSDRPHSDRPGGDRPRSGGKPWERPWEKKPGGADRKPGFQGRSSERPHKPAEPRGPDREPRRNDAPPAPPRPDRPHTPPGSAERPHIKSRRPFQPRAGFPKGPRRS